MRSGGQKTELPEPNDLVFLADQGLLAMDIYKIGDFNAAKNMGEELIQLLRQKGLSLFRRAIIELLISEISNGRLSGDNYSDPRAHAFESMQILAKLWEYGIPPDLESAVQFVELRAQKIGMPYVEERVREEAGWRKESSEGKDT